MSWSTPRSWAAGEVVTGALLDQEVRDNLKSVEELAYNTYASNVTVSATAWASANEVIHSGTLTYEAVPHIIEFECSRVSVPGASGANTLQLQVADASTRLGIASLILNSAGAGGVEMQVPVRISFRVTPTAGSHEYRIIAIRGNANCTVFGGAGGADTENPMQITVRRLPTAP